MESSIESNGLLEERNERLEERTLVLAGASIRQRFFENCIKLTCGGYDETMISIGNEWAHDGALDADCRLCWKGMRHDEHVFRGLYRLCVKTAHSPGESFGKPIFLFGCLT